jgi:hypothetical protein
MQARRSRGAAYLARLGPNDVDNALIDQQAAGLAGIQLPIRAATADLKVGTTVAGRVKQNQIVLVTIIKGSWLWVEAVDGSDRLRGYIPKQVVLAQAPPKATTPLSTSQPVAAGTMTPRSGTTNYPRNNYSQSPSGQRGGYYNNYEQGGSGNNRQGGYNSRQGGGRNSDRPPSIWQTPEWETPAEIRRGRANGTLR